MLKKYWRELVIVVLAILFFLKGCGGDSEEQIITIPEKKGSFKEVKNPEPIVKNETLYKYKYLTKEKEVEVNVPNPVNEELMQFYLEHKNKDSLYADAIGERDYMIPYEDSLVKTENYIKAQGKVLSFRQDYTIKEQKVKVTPRQTIVRVLGGLEIGNTTMLDGFQAKGNVMIQNKKGNIISFGYDTEQRIWVGYNINIFDIKK